MLVQNNCLPKHREDVLRNGLKFENDRKFKNRLILKTILLMAVLVVVATCGFVTWSRLRSDHQYAQPIKITTIIRKVSIDYDIDMEMESERVISPEIRTQYVPPKSSMVASHTRTVRDVNQQQPYEEDNSTTDYPEEELEELIWVKVSDKTKRNIVEKNERRNYDQPTLSPTERTSSSQSTFWTTQGSAESIRQSQADRITSLMDATADPCDDFYQYACGKWDQLNTIPDDRGGFDTFEMLRDNLQIVLRDLLLEPSEEVNDTAIRKAKLFYKGCMNEESIEKLGNQPLLTLIDSLGGWPILNPNWNETGFDWIEMTSNIRLYLNDVFISFWIGQDLTSSINVITIDQIGLSLPSREYYLKEQHKLFKEAYKVFVAKSAIMLGADSATAYKDAEEIVNFETALANITLGPDERRNLSLFFEKITLGRLEAEIPQVGWRRYLSKILDFEVADSETIVLGSRKFFMLLGPLLESTPPRTIANYVMWRFAKHRINNLSERFQDIKQEFLHVLYGREKKPPRWTACVQQVNGHMGMALGALFVKRYFDESSKNNTIIMTQSIMNTFRDMLEGITWINDETRDLAKEKVQRVTLRIGYPDFILNSTLLNEYFENITISEDQHFDNTINVLQAIAQIEVYRLRTVVNRTHWMTAPTIVNAFYARNRNQILVPAGILQPPFYHRHFPRSLNYGGIGAVIGHELIHAFDDKGRLYDVEGNLNRWWKEDEIQSFRSKTKCIVDQYNSYTVPEFVMRIDGVNTQGENIADNSGLKLAFHAYEKWLAQNGDANETLSGLNLTNYQLFFLNFAQIWCGSLRPETYKNKIQTSAHPPGRFRVIGTLSNSEEFARVFKCSVGSNMNPKAKCRIW